MLQVQEKAPQAAEEASRNINNGASEVRWRRALLPSVLPAPATFPAPVAWAQSASAQTTIQMPWPCYIGCLTGSPQLLASCLACSQSVPASCPHQGSRLQVANQARPRADEVSQKVEGAARNVAQNARPMADKASEQLNAGAKSAAGKAALSCQRAPEKQQACAPVAEQRNEAPIEAGKAGMWGQAVLCSIADADVIACSQNTLSA